MNNVLPFEIRSKIEKVFCLIFAFGFFVLPANHALAQNLQVTEPNYKQAYKFDRSYLNQFSYSTSVTPKWIGKTDRFWYSFRTSKGKNWFVVDPTKKTKDPLFDHVILVMKLSELSRKPVDANKLPLDRESLDKEGKKLKFVVGKFQYEYDLASTELKKLGKAPARTRFPTGRRFRSREEFERFRRQFQQRQNKTQKKNKTKAKSKRSTSRRGRTYSSDRKAYFFVKDFNLFVTQPDGKKKTKTIQITDDGKEDYTFSSRSRFFGRRRRRGRSSTTLSRTRPTAWSKDSKSFYTTRSDSRGVQELFLVDSLGEPRPTLQKYKYPMPGESKIRKSELWVYNRDTEKAFQVEPKWKDESYRNIHWGKNPDELRFIRHDRLLRNIEFCSLNPKTGESKVLFEEGFENAYLQTQPIRYLEKSNQLIWWSERSGWGHYYLYSRDGKLKNAITSGPFRSSRIVSVDEEKRILYFTGNARESGENIYLNHLYSVNFDGSHLTLMDPGNADHRSTLSPTKQYVVDNCSRIDMAPVSILRDAKGKEIMKLESCDISRLVEAGWKMPSTFMVKAADGVTDLYGNMWKPFNFDPKKKYPIIAYVYPGPQQEGLSQTFSAINSRQQLAQLGFIVIQVGHRGGAPTRSKAYHAYSYGNLRDYGLADKKAAIEQLAARFPFINIEKVGIYGHSGGGFMSAAAVLQKPYNEFFKAAVASSGNHDNNIYNNSWSERYHGLKQVKVEKDKGKKKESKTSSKTKKTTTGRGLSKRKQGGDSPELLQKKNKKKKVKQKKRKITSTKKTATAKQTAKKVKKKVTTKKTVAKKEAKKKTTTKKNSQKKGHQKKSVKKNSAKKTEKKKSIGVKSKKTFDDIKFEIKVPTNTELAANLKGALLLVHGEIDNNVHPANTMRLVNALIKANKRFDMLILPGKRHGYGDFQPYFEQRMWEFFAEHLMGDHREGADIYDKRNGKK